MSHQGSERGPGRRVVSSVEVLKGTVRNPIITGCAAVAGPRSESALGPGTARHERNARNQRVIDVGSCEDSG